MLKKFKKRNRGSDHEAQPRDEEFRAHEMSISGHHGESSGVTRSNVPAVQADCDGQAGPSTRSQAPNDEPPNSGDNRQPGGTSDDTTQPTPSEEPPPMIGDFDERTNALWSLQMKEAQSHDEARIQSLKHDMDGVLIFAGLFSAALVSFITDQVQALQVDPAQQMVYYQQQNVALLAQISKQVSSITPQVIIPSSPPPPYPNFTPNPSDVRVNVYWFMSLVFSLSAALFATLVQQWVRDYMQVFQRYGDPLKGARLRQYLYEGAEGWYMLVVAESVPGLVHVSLFLFFLGLIDSLLSINTTVGITTIVPITLCGLLYVLCTFAPIVDPQSPFHTPLSSLIWYLTGKLYPRTYLDRASGGALRTVSSNMSEGQMQLAMEENEDRKYRDVRAMQWLIDNSTKDDEMDSFVMAIPGAFESKWGIEIWRTVADANEDEGANTTPTDADLQVSVLSPHGSPLPQYTRHPRSPLHFFRPFRGTRTVTVNDIPHNVTLTRSISHTRNDAARDPVIINLCKRVQRLLDTCESLTKLSLRQRARGCVETVASLVLCANVKLEPRGLERLLRKLGEIEKVREISVAGSDSSFVTRWACLYLVVVTRKAVNHPVISSRADNTIRRLSEFRLEDDAIHIDDVDEKALRISRRIDGYFESARQICIGLKGAFRPDQEGRTEEQVREALARDYEANISNLERAIPVTGLMEPIDMGVSRINHLVTHAFGYSLLPGLSFDEFKRTELIEPAQFFNISDDDAQLQFFMPQILFLNQRLRLLCSYAPKLRDIINGRADDGVYQETLDSLGTLWYYDKPSRSAVGRHRLMERQLWRLMDLRDGGGFGFFVELFFLMLAQRLSMASSPYTHPALHIGTFRAITSGWREHKHSIGTQRVILNLICDIVIPNRGLISDHTYPEYITNELLVLLGNMVEGQSGEHIDDTMVELGHNLGLLLSGDAFATEVMAVISRRCARHLPLHP